ncbi:hypothetical protein [Bufonid herpesvirus 1]|uniref:hypothetical protein n=1 Tax=Bufonid herpesvirus 1 TaxID=2282206 RepID=UPI000EB68000|nr:hypothetical protein [Bufonid herpesvirus 1]AXF48555.1 hypothetical protein [Bufonid herpesvirus 1]
MYTQAYQPTNLYTNSNQDTTTPYLSGGYQMSVMMMMMMMMTVLTINPVIKAALLIKDKRKIIQMLTKVLMLITHQAKEKHRSGALMKTTCYSLTSPKNITPD